MLNEQEIHTLKMAKAGAFVVDENDELVEVVVVYAVENGAVAVDVENVVGDEIADDELADDDVAADNAVVVDDEVVVDDGEVGVAAVVAFVVVPFVAELPMRLQQKPT